MPESTTALRIRAEVPKEKISELVILLAVALTKNYPGIGPELINVLARRKVVEKRGITLVFIVLRPYSLGWEEADKGYVFTVRALTKQEAAALLKENLEISAGVPKTRVKAILNKCETGMDQKQAGRDIESAKELLHTFFINNRIKDELL